MDLSKLIKDIAANAKDEAAAAQPQAPGETAAPVKRRVVAADQAAAPSAAAPAATRFTTLAQLAELDDAAAARILDAVQPDDVVITTAANPDDELRRWLLAPLDQESRHWVVDNAMQLGEPTANLAREAAERILATANRLAAEGALEAGASRRPPARAESDYDHLTPPQGVPTLAPHPEHLHLSPTVGFAVGGNPATSHTAVRDGEPEAASGEPDRRASSASADASRGSSTDDELSDLRRQLAHLIALAQRHGQEAVAALADEAPHPLLQAGLQLLSRPIAAGELDQVLLDAQQQLERCYREQCDLVRHAITAIHDGTKPEDFLAAN